MRTACRRRPTGGRRVSGRAGRCGFRDRDRGHARSPADPAARRTGAHGGQAFFAYSTNYLIDVEHAVIVDVEATTAIRQAEVLAARRMIERPMDRSSLYPARLMGDSAYGSAEMLGWLVHEHGIEPHVTLFDKSARKDGTFSRADFTYDQQHVVYRCPGGTALRTTGSLVNDGATMLYSALQRECAGCVLKPRCCPNTPAQRSRARSIKVRATWPGRSPTHGKGHLSTAAQEEMLLAQLKRTSSSIGYG